MTIPLTEDPELFTELTGPDGERTRARLLAQLGELQTRLAATDRGGVQHEDFQRLEAVRQAVEAARSALQSLKVGATKP